MAKAHREKKPKNGEVPNVVPEDDATPPDFASIQPEASNGHKPAAALVERPTAAPSQSLVNVHVHGSRAIVREDDGPKDTDKQIDMGDLFGTPSDEQFNPLSELLSEEAINMKTDLTDGLIIALARCEVAADMFEVPELRNVCHAIKTMRVSRGRKGRQEIVEAIKGHPPQDGTASFMQKLKNTVHT